MNRTPAVYWRQQPERLVQQLAVGFGLEILENIQSDRTNYKPQLGRHLDAIAEKRADASLQGGLAGPQDHVRRQPDVTGPLFNGEQRQVE